ncbi:MAG: M14 family zinc carboxypeptidase [Parashewanella sp.]
MKKSTLSLICGLLLSTHFSQPAIADIQTQFELPKQVNYLNQITSPNEFLGYPLGKWHLRHDQLNFYLKTLAQQSSRASIEQTGQSHEDRQQLSLVITSQENQAQLANILEQRAQVKQGKKSKGPLVIWLAYSIHGDEASGAHAGMALSYYLSASQEPWVKQLLDEAVIIITPSQNPDGMDRFATWANNNRSNSFNSDPNNREHHQHWPGGRLNHYLADLNRDWLFLRHPESQGRVALFHKWQPHYVGDFHEMGHHASYFFQPGVPSRTHPLTPTENQQLTDEIANYHRQALDAVGQPYYSKQSFDDFFYGKGSTYPDINGAIGVLFEQASARGQAQDSPNGVVTLARAIQNQFSTSLSSLKGTLALKDKLHNYQTKFFEDKQSDSGRQQGLLLSSQSDQYKRDAFASILKQHKIKFHYLNQSISRNNANFTPEHSLFIPYQQPQSALVTALFDKRTRFKDSTFYDVSSFDLAAALALKTVEKVKLSTTKLTDKYIDVARQDVPADSVAILIDWKQNSAMPVLQQLLANNVVVKFTSSAFRVNTATGKRIFGAGSLQIPLKQDKLSREQILQLTQTAANKFNLPLHSVSTFAAISGGDLGSPNMHQVMPVKPILVTGSNVAMEAGQVWNFLDNRLHMPVTQVDGDKLSRVKLSAYSHVLLPHGNYHNIDAKSVANLTHFVKQGGVIIAHKAALSWLRDNDLLKAKLFDYSKAKSLFNTRALSFADKGKLNAKMTIGGAIATVDLDLSHPLNYGLTQPQIKIMKKGVLAIESPAQPFRVAGKYADTTLASGFMAQEYQQALPNKTAMLVEPYGKGAIVAFSDNLLFRNIWLGSEKIYANALFFIPQIH